MKRLENEGVCICVNKLLDIEFNTISKLLNFNSVTFDSQHSCMAYPKKNQHKLWELLDKQLLFQVPTSKHRELVAKISRCKIVTLNILLLCCLIEI